LIVAPLPSPRDRIISPIVLSPCYICLAARYRIKIRPHDPSVRVTPGSKRREEKLQPILKDFYKSEGNKVAIVFVHGFTGDVQGTWGNIPNFLHQQPALNGWDLAGFGYQSKRSFDILNLWSADASLEEISTKLNAALDLAPYDRIVLVAHSMGGLIVERALVKYPKLRARVSQVILFGTPSKGLVKATLVSWLKQQTRNMSAGGPFVQGLRQDWTKLDTAKELPPLLAVAGETDQFVPPDSSLGPFAEDMRRVIPGNHLSMLSAASADAPCVQMILQTLTRGAAPAGPRSAARLAVEEGKFHQVIETLWPIRKELDDTGIVSLGLALDAVGRRQDAIQILEGQEAQGTDAFGVLGGRYKRRWLLERHRADAEKAVDMYRRGYGRSSAKAPPDHEQAFYHCINLAFMELAYGGDFHAARDRAAEVLEHCRLSENRRDPFWRIATEADAQLILGHIDEGIGKHAEAAKLPMQPRQALSIQEQAMRTADLSGCSPEQIEEIAALYEGRT
jgi:pimeloyl-ACP methyl ester carboxylesterase